ncbi:MAG: SusD/RagB family nutrient-binding outer membrane lipoprotein [Saprospiraceae bacterium]|nr:SusD/RagB family nutrient-binding outer membrane lipoprotein [Saprospiraceae bacterium]
MKNIKIWMLVLLIGLSNACTKDFDSINTNPNRPEEVPLTNVLVSAVSQGVRRTHGASMNMTYAGLWAQHYAKIQYIDEDWYEYRPDAMTAHWDGMYTGPLADLQDIINRAPNPSNMRAAAMTMRAYYFAIMTDMWGNIPYTEALSPDRTFNPVYDSQDVIYAGLIQELKDAAAMFDPGGDNLGAGDLIYAGDATLWKKFANSVRARLLNRAKGKNAAYATELQTLLSSPANLIASNAENAQMGYVDATGNGSNPIYSNKHNDGRNDHAVSKTLVDLMTGDPRLAVYADVNNGGNYVGQPNGTVEPNPFSAVSQIGTAFRDNPLNPSYLFTYAEVLFIKAEANNDKQAYLDAIAASCEQFGVTPDAGFLTAVGTAYDGGAAKALGTQKWIALFGDGCEAFSEFRRTGFPSEVVEVPLSGYPGQGVPRRFVYPTSETGNNKINLESAIQAQAIDASGLFGNKMWWAQ